MLNLIRKRASAALLCACLTPALGLAASPVEKMASSVTAVYQVDQVIVMKETGKGDRRCKVLAVNKQANGVIIYQVKALDTGERITIQAGVSAPQMAEASSVSKKHMTDEKSVSNKLSTDLPTPAPSNELSMKRGLDQPSETVGKSATVVTPSVKKPEIPCATCPPAAEKPPRYLLSRIFSKSSTQKAQNDSCVKCKEAPAKAQPPGRATVVSAQPVPVSAAPTLMPKVAEPAPMIAGPAILPAQKQPAVASMFPSPVDPMTETASRQSVPHMTAEETLKNAMMPSQRIAAAEEMSMRMGSRMTESRAALMMAVQKDSAGCVRAACIRCLAKNPVHDEAFISLLVSAKEDKDAEVREEAAYTLEKLKR